MLSSLTIDNFRGFSHLEVRDLGRVNLLVGMNNCGKTSLLEAIQLLVARGTLDSIYSIASRRGEHLSTSISRQPQAEVDICRLFHNYELDVGSSFHITGMINRRKESLAATILELTEEIEQERLFDRPADDDAPEYPNPYLLSLTWEGKDVVEESLRVSPHGGISVDSLVRRPARRHEKTIESHFISTNSLSVNRVVSLFENTVLTPEEDLVVEALQLIEPTIERLASVGTDRRYPSPSYPGSRGGIMAKCTGAETRIPIGSLGDGIWRMLGLILTLVRSEGGVILIDEIDTGLHFSVMSDMWKLVSETAKRLNIQVFATTHSNDCWTSLAEIARQHVVNNNDITIQRIERDKPQAIGFTEQEIVIAASRDIEMR